MTEHPDVGDWNAVGEWFVDYWTAPGTWLAMPDERKQNMFQMLPAVVHEWDMATTGVRPLEDWGAITAPVHLMRAADTRAPTREIVKLLAKTYLPLGAFTTCLPAAIWRRSRAQISSIR